MYTGLCPPSTGVSVSSKFFDPNRGSESSPSVRPPCLDRGPLYGRESVLQCLNTRTFTPEAHGRHPPRQQDTSLTNLVGKNPDLKGKHFMSITLGTVPGLTQNPPNLLHPSWCADPLGFPTHEGAGPI